MLPIIRMIQSRDTKQRSNTKLTQYYDKKCDNHKLAHLVTLPKRKYIYWHTRSAAVTTSFHWDSSMVSCSGYCLAPFAPNTQCRFSCKLLKCLRAQMHLAKAGRRHYLLPSDVWKAYPVTSNHPLMHRGSESFSRNACNFRIETKLC